MRDAEEYLKRNNIRYAEIFFAPSKFVMNGIPFPAMVEQLEQGAEEIKRRTGIEIRYIIDVSRSYGVENAQRNLDLTFSSHSPRIIGIGLGGSETAGPAKEYLSVFKKAIAGG
jgi:adenosine deaminase